MMKIISRGLILAILFVSCKAKTDPNEEWSAYAEQIVSNWQGKKMSLPTDLPIVLPDSTSDLFNKNFSAPLKVVTFVDGTCGVCIGNLKHWQTFMDFVKQRKEKCDFIFYIQADDKDEFEKGVMSKLKLNFPWILDKNDRFILENKLLDQRFQTALLDSNNEVLLIGSIMFNPKLEELYKKTIEQKSAEHSPLVSTK